MPISQINTASLASGTPARANLPTGCVLQVVSTTKTDSFTGSTLGAWTDITGMSVSITPTTANSKVLVQVFMQGGSYDGIEKASWRLVRNSTPINVGDAAGSRPQATGDQGGPNQYWPPYTGTGYLDSPNTTSAVTYKIQYYCSGSAQFWVNRCAADRDTSNYDARTTSTIMVMEIAG